MLFADEISLVPPLLAVWNFAAGWSRHELNYDFSMATLRPLPRKHRAQHHSKPLLAAT